MRIKCLDGLIKSSSEQQEESMLKPKGCSGEGATNEIERKGLGLLFVKDLYTQLTSIEP